MKTFWRLGCLLLLLASISFSVLGKADQTNIIDHPLPTEFSREKWRQIYLELLHASPWNSYEVLNPPQDGTPQAKLLSFFMEKIVPVELRIRNISGQYSALRILLDSGLFDSAQEKEDWTRRMQGILAEFSAFESDEAYQGMVREAGRLAEGLSGDLPDELRRDAKRLELTSYPARMKRTLMEAEKLSAQIDSVASGLPAKDRSLQAQTEFNRVADDYFKGRTTFPEASARLESLWMEATGATIGKELITAAGKQLQRVAHLRSRLAKEKGFTNWADFQVTIQAESHSEGFRTVKDLLRFLYGLLDATDATARRVYEQAALKIGRSYQSLRPVEMYLLNEPAESLLYGYFPKEKVEPIWRQTMEESGFTDAQTRRVMTDSFPRTNKQGHAYMSPVRRPFVMHPQIDGQTLNLIRPADESSDWSLAVTAIVQNLTDDDLDGLRTMFHEGGHAKDFASQRPLVDRRAAYGYSETHSTQMESFLRDAGFLLRHGQTRDGRPLEPKLVAEYLRRADISKLLSFRGTVAQAIFDLELWSYDYSQPKAAAIWARSIDLSARIFKRLRFVKLPSDLSRSRGWSAFSTSHFYGGSVNYTGYVLAAVSADMMTRSLLDRLEQSTGRRSLNQQPQIASILTPLYRRGGETDFPKSIETFTGRKFSAEEFAGGLVDQVNQALGYDLAIKSCDELLQEPPIH